ncbi:ankyrin repeat domain-containing protein [archaeon]|nr:MAG: ankyrin repeat domain-containing protein [archaeon]
MRCHTFLLLSPCKRYNSHTMPIVDRNSKDLVEAAFDGDLEVLQAQIDKGYHIESVDGRKHTALSEAASQGHMHVVQYLLQHGANPNALNDTSRSPLWRATFNSHIGAVKLLLEAGGNPQFRDTVSLENAFDVAQTEELRTLLVSPKIAKHGVLRMIMFFSCIHIG